MIVTAVQQKRKYTLITFGNEKTFAVDPSLVKKYGAKEDSGVDMMALLDENEDFAYDLGLEYAFRILAVSAKTHREMADKLYGRNIQTKAVIRIMQRLTELGYINDASYAEDYVSLKKENGLSKRAITNKLRLKGISEDIIASAMTDYTDEEEFSHAEYFAAKFAEKYDSLEYEKLKNKLFSRLSSKGFSTSAIYHAAGVLKEKYNLSYCDKEALSKTAARMSMRGMNREEIYGSLIKKSNSPDYDELIIEILNELFE